MEDHPGIVFRDGPAGRRAALAVDARIAHNSQEADRRRAASERAREALGW
jgi:hypothetical protein